LRAQDIHLVLAKSELEAMMLGEAMDAAERKAGGRVLGCARPCLRDRAALDFLEAQQRSSESGILGIWKRPVLADADAAAPPCRIGPGTMCCGENWSADISCYNGLHELLLRRARLLRRRGHRAGVWDYAAALTAPRAAAPRDGVWIAAIAVSFLVPVPRLVRHMGPEPRVARRMGSETIGRRRIRSAAGRGGASTSSRWTTSAIAVCLHRDEVFIAVCDGGRAMLDAVRQCNAPKSGH
jgi:hypothetical protein